MSYKKESKIILTESDYKKLILNLAMKRLGYNRVKRRKILRESKLLRENYNPANNFIIRFKPKGLEKIKKIPNVQLGAPGHQEALNEAIKILESAGDSPAEAVNYIKAIKESSLSDVEFQKQLKEKYPDNPDLYARLSEHLSDITFEEENALVLSKQQKALGDLP